MSKNTSKNFIAFAFGVIASLLLLELILRIINPTHFTLKGDKIILHKSETEVFRNTEIPKLDSLIHHSTNSLGFRGPEKPKDFENYLTIFAVGGSTTECRFLSDGKDWPALLANMLKAKFRRVWINNSGLDGHSTFGHMKLLQEHILQYNPKIVMLLVGRNDVLRGDLNWDSELKESVYTKTVNLLSHSEVFSLFLNLYRVYKAEKRNLRHFNLDLTTAGKLIIPDSIISQKVEFHERSFIPSYKDRLQQIIDTCRKNKVEPVFITQPALVGDGIDSIAHVDLATVKTGNSENGKLLWTVLEAYNQATKKVGEKNHCLVIDLAEKMPKNSLYFYDYIHFTNEGSAIVADIVFQDLSSWLDTAKVGKSVIAD